MANLTLATQIIFDAVNRRKNDINLYKYEMEGMKRSYMENYFNAMDSLISELTEEISADDPADIRLAMEDWRKTNYYKMLSKLKVDTADEFDEIYPIDLSYLFFSVAFLFKRGSRRKHRRLLRPTRTGRRRPGVC